MLWLLLVIALAVVWWYLRPAPEHLGSSGDSSALAEITGDDPDDILVDLRDDTSDAKVAQLESELGLDLVLVSAQSQDERFYRAKVSPARRDACLLYTSPSPRDRTRSRMPSSA